MLLNLTDHSSESLQSQIKRQVRAKILSGEIPAEAALPSIRGLSKDQRISVITVQRAYESLERGGFIYSRRGKGYFVTEIADQRKKEIAKERLYEAFEPLIADAISEGLTESEIFETINIILNKNTVFSIK